MYSIILITQDIAKVIQKHMDCVAFRWKENENTGEYGETKPKVYTFTYDDMGGGWPLHTPAILVQCVGIEVGLAHYVLHICVCNPATQDAEITIPVENNSNTYEYDKDDDITSDVVRSELYKACLMLGEQSFIALERMGNDKYSISNIYMDTPSPYMENFPYCECAVKFDVKIPKTEYVLNTKLMNML